MEARHAEHSRWLEPRPTRPVHDVTDEITELKFAQTAFRVRRHGACTRAGVYYLDQPAQE